MTIDQGKLHALAGKMIGDKLGLFRALRALRILDQICVPASMSQRGRTALGAQAGEKRITDTIKSGGFSRVKRATATPFNMIIEARI